MRQSSLLLFASSSNNIDIVMSLHQPSTITTYLSILPCSIRILLSFIISEEANLVGLLLPADTLYDSFSCPRHVIHRSLCDIHLSYTRERRRTYTRTVRRHVTSCYLVPSLSAFVFKRVIINASLCISVLFRLGCILFRRTLYCRLVNQKEKAADNRASS